MLNPFKEVNWRPQRNDLRKFGVSWLIGFPAFALLTLLVRGIVTHHWQFGFPMYLAAFGIVGGTLFYLVPMVARPFYVVWYALACCMGILIGNLLLIAFYFLIVTPTALALKLFGKSTLRKKPEASCGTYWKQAEAVEDVRRYYHQS